MVTVGSSIHIDDARVEAAAGLVVDAQTLRHPRPEGDHYSVGPGYKGLGRLPPL